MSTQCGDLLHSKKTEEKGLEKHTILSKPVSDLDQLSLPLILCISLRHFFDFPRLQILIPEGISPLFSCPGQTVVAEIVVLIFSLDVGSNRRHPSEFFKS